MADGLFGTRLDSRTLDQLREIGIDPSRLKERTTPFRDQPYTTAGLPSLQTLTAPELQNTNTRGFMLGSNVIADFNKNRAQTQALFLRPDADKNVIAHEQEHLLARQGLGTGSAINRKFDKLLGEKGTALREQFVKDAIASGNYLKEKYGINDAYFDPSMLKQGGTALYEQLATLAGYEAANGVDLTKDPILRKTLFKNKDVRETYNAITGLRQTRLDAKDLPTYTRQPELAEPGMVDRFKQLFGLSQPANVQYKDPFADTIR
jgi:hypothetical protein